MKTNRIEDNISLTIHEIQDLKTGKKSYDEIIKCRAIRTAERLGESAIVEEHYDENGAYTGKTITYKNGLEIELSNPGIPGTPVKIKTENGETVEYRNNFTGGNWATVYEEGDSTGNILNNPKYGQSKDFFKENPGSRVSELNHEEQSEFDHFIDDEGHTNPQIKSYVKGEMTEDEVMAFAKEADRKLQRNVNISDIYQPQYRSMLDYEPTFRDIVSNNSFENSPSFLTMKVVNSNSIFSDEKAEWNELDLSKRITTNSSYRIDSSGGDVDYMATSPGDNDNWVVLTLHDKGNPKNCGVDLQNSKSPSGYRDYRTATMTEAPFITAPGQKFRKEVVDYENHIVYQVIH